MFLQIICSFLTWLLIGVSLWKIREISVSGLTYVKKLHQVPCDRCVYFTGDYRLKCTVNPLVALSEEAINCRDFEPIAHSQKIPNLVSIKCNCSVETCHSAFSKRKIK
jgi:hypothetical protein